MAKMFPIQFVSLFLEECLRDPRVALACRCGHLAAGHEDKYGECQAGCDCVVMRPELEFRGFNV